LNLRPGGAKCLDQAPPAATSAAEPFLNPKEESVAKTSPGEFIRQVRTEAAKVVWPTRKETARTAIMVLIMAGLLAIFFFLIDSLFSTVVQFLMRFVG
jgi:preprotein translocase subunit SecE